jgi:hypothetical protein
MPVPDFSPGEVLTAAAMDSIGLWLVKTQTIGTTVASVTVTGAFSADYDNYRIVVSGVDASNDAEGLRLTLSGVTGLVYKINTQFCLWGNNAFTATGSTGVASGFLFGFVGSTDNTNMFGDLFNPQKALQTGFLGQSSSQSYLTIGGGVCTSVVQSTGFTLTVDNGTITGGTIRIYGYRN